MVNLTFVSESGNLLTLEANAQSPLNTLCPALASSFSIPSNQQEMRLDGVTLDITKTVSAAGLSNGDMILVLQKNQTQQQQQQQQQGNNSLARGLPTPAAMLSALRSDSSLMQRIRSQNSSLHDRIMQGDESALSEVGSLLRNSSSAAASGMDPMSADAQRAIEEEIRAANVRENMEAAFEHNPESFGSVVMLFVDCKINGVAGKAFVDRYGNTSIGAQATILSRECAERCNILRLMDTRFTGVARGVGTAKILGRIHLALLTLGTDLFEVTFTVMDAVGGGYDMLLGLDMLRKHQANIDLKHNCLRIGNVSVPFLSEKDIPRNMLGEPRDSGSSSNPRPSTNTPSNTPSTANTTTAQPTSNSRSNEDPISKLVELGFSRNEAEEALRACNGNADQAAAMLAANKYGF